VSASPEILAEWERSAHARAGINCSRCHHAPAGEEGNAAEWADLPGRDVCGACHEQEAKGFREGRHGMRLAVGLDPMRPGLARLPMRAEASGRELSCTTCHGAHGFDTRRAAVDACLGCHRDEHSLAYPGSPHHELWMKESEARAGTASGVSCATCHLPREHAREGGATRISVQHNQNNNLRPNEKMLRTVCMHCHGLGFSIDALADPELIRDNFRGRPAARVESLDLVRRRARSR
jgi:formate-dependent nitrite reductase cytochrome c552 subunit